MNTQIKRYISELEDLFSGVPWIDMSILLSIKGIDAKKAFYKPRGWSNSIAQILCHLLEWRTSLYKRIAGIPFNPVDQKDSFNVSKYGKTNTAIWKKLVGLFKENQKNLIEVLSEKDDSFLTSEVHNKNNGHFYISAIIQHDYYHMGQIALLKSYIKRNYKKRK